MVPPLGTFVCVRSPPSCFLFVCLVCDSSGFDGVRSSVMAFCYTWIDRIESIQSFGYDDGDGDDDDADGCASSAVRPSVYPTVRAPDRRNDEDARPDPTRALLRNRRYAPDSVFEHLPMGKQYEIPVTPRARGFVCCPVEGGVREERLTLLVYRRIIQ